MRTTHTFDNSMRRLALFQELDTPHYKAFVLRHVEQRTRINSVRIIFFPGGIAICGDLCPGGGNNGGVISDIGYGLGWFASDLSGSYLCSKFMREEFVPALAMAEIQGWVEDIQDRIDLNASRITEIEDEEGDELFKADLDESIANERIDELEDIIGKLDSNEIGPHGLGEALGDLDYSYVDDGLPGYGYPIRDAQLLIAIQKRFAYLYKHDLRQTDNPLK